jgi:coproporphyrinogen III oxidase-like Fe-S oxidoreductase
MIPEFVSYITRREGRKFLRLDPSPGDTVINASRPGPGSGLSLYAHIPFCRSLCPFCCFNRYLFKEDLARRYFADLKQELELYLERGFAFSNVYFGGGTPTVLMDELAAFITHLRARCRIEQVSLRPRPATYPQNIGLLK